MSFDLIACYSGRARPSIPTRRSSELLEERRIPPPLVVMFPPVMVPSMMFQGPVRASRASVAAVLCWKEHRLDVQPGRLHVAGLVRANMLDSAVVELSSRLCVPVLMVR